MNTTKLITSRLSLFSLAVLAACWVAGCASTGTKATPTVATATPAVSAPTVPPTPAVTVPVAEVPAVKLPLRIKAGATESFTDKNGNLWLADRGFADGETTERPDASITGAGDARIYQSERYSMTAFTQPLPNGKYLVKLHFCETYDGITGPGQRVFSFSVAGHEFKDFDVWAKSGGFQHAYVETVPVEITTGKLEITFTSNIENPEINGIEILAAP